MRFYAEKSLFLKKNAETFGDYEKMHYLCTRFKELTNSSNKANLIMVAVVQLVRASDCGSECRGFESHLPPS